MTKLENRCSICWLENHATIDEYKKIILEIMMQEPKKLWEENELKEMASKIATTRKHMELGII